jgi:hypothetical protein
VDRDEIIRVLRAFEEKGLEYVLIGASAMAFHGLVRATEDLDLFIRATPENVERLREALKDAYADDPQIDMISSTDLLGEYPAIRYYPPTGDLYLDVLTRLGESARFETVEAEVREIEGTHVRIATPAALYRSIEEMNNAPIRRGDFESFLRHCARWWAIAPKRYPRGVFKFRTIEEAQEARRKHSINP